jgi:hypothetical protein
MRKLRILLGEVIGLGLLLAWLMWKYPEFVDDIIPWVALVVAWHFTWELILDTRWCRGAAVAFGKKVNRVLIWFVVFLIGGTISLVYWAGINKSLGRLASLAAQRAAKAKSLEPPVSLTPKQPAPIPTPPPAPAPQHHTRPISPAQPGCAPARRVPDISRMPSADIAREGLITANLLHDMSVEWGLTDPMAAGPNADELFRAHRRRFQECFRPLMIRAKEQSEIIVSRLSPDFNGRRKDKQFSEFFRKALAGGDYGPGEVDDAGTYLSAISKELQFAAREDTPNH